MATNPKYLFVTGGVVSSLGKGIFSASIGAVLESKGLKVTIQKLYFVTAIQKMEIFL